MQDDIKAIFAGGGLFRQQCIDPRALFNTGEQGIGAVIFIIEIDAGVQAGIDAAPDDPERNMWGLGVAVARFGRAGFDGF